MTPLTLFEYYLSLIILLFLLTIVTAIVRVQWRRVVPGYIETLTYFISHHGPPMFPTGGGAEMAEPTDKIIRQPWQYLIERRRHAILPTTPPALGIASTDSWLDDSLELFADGFEVVIDDSLSARFLPTPLKQWNFLWRTKPATMCLTTNQFCLWLVGAMVRYGIFVPVRVMTLIFSFVWFAIALWLPEKMPFRKTIGTFIGSRYTILYSKGQGLMCRFYNRQYRAVKGSLAVAGPHASPNDIQMLWTDSGYSCTGQKHGGLIGFFQKATSNVNDALWFNRRLKDDRKAFFDMIHNYAQDTTKHPLLLFPEGYCSNNTALMQFRKGAFENPNTTIYPIAMSYDPRFGDNFWREDSFLLYVWRVNTAWANLYDITYLPPTRRREDETAGEFTSRVEEIIAKAAGVPRGKCDPSLWYKDTQRAKQFIQEQYAKQTLEPRQNGLRL